jgi:biotin synthase-like enzyme
MRKALFTLIVICSASLVSELIPYTSAFEDINAQDINTSILKIQKQNLSPNSKISHRLYYLMTEMNQMGISSYKLNSQNMRSFSTPFVKVDNSGNVQVYVHLNELNDNDLKRLNDAGLDRFQNNPA